MKSKQLGVVGIVALTVMVLMGSLSLSWAGARAGWQRKVDPGLLERAVEQRPLEFIVVLQEQADLGATANLSNKLDKGTYVYDQLTAVAEKTQPPIIEALESAGASYRRFWVTNSIWVNGDASLVEQLAQRADIKQIHANPYVRLDVLGNPKQRNAVENDPAIEWNIDLVRAPELWAAGITGQGIVIGGQDTGYDWEHPALINQYRGWNGTTADHNYNWHDAIHAGSGSSPDAALCGYDSPFPCDDYGHGTHTMGTMVGDDGNGNLIGMAPHAQWIGCRNMLNGVGTPATYMECYEWFIAPYPVGGNAMLDGDPAKAPHVINNSWSCPVSEGCTDPDVLKDVVKNVRAAGILTVHSAGNNGFAGCSTISEPAAIYDDSFTVAATTGYDFIASFSSRGPIIVGDNNPAKPDISAPGLGVRSSLRDGSYGTMSGTSMAAPHVAGLAALLMSAQPALIGDVDGIEQVIEESAVPRYTNEGCGGDSVESRPNHVYGWGRIDAKQACDALDNDPFCNVTFLPISIGR